MAWTRVKTVDQTSPQTGFAGIDIGPSLMQWFAENVSGGHRICLELIRSDSNVVDIIVAPIAMTVSIPPPHVFKSWKFYVEFENEAEAVLFRLSLS